MNTPETSTSETQAMIVSEILFAGFLLIVTTAAFVEALTYDLVSSRTPFVIMVPLLILLLIHFTRQLKLLKVSGAEGSFLQQLTSLKTGTNGALTTGIAFFVSLLVLALLIAVFGHYLAVFIYTFFVVCWLGKRTWLFSFLLAAGLVVALIVLFEFAFNIELYRGLIPRYFMGYRDFG